MSIPILKQSKPQSKWFKIKDDIFYAESISCQLSIGSHGTIDLSVNLNVYPNYRQYFYDLFDKMHNRKTGQSHYKKDCVFEVLTPHWKGIGCMMKSMDINMKMVE